MKTKEKTLAAAYILISSITVLVMLNDWFEQFQEKYFPSFIAAQKFALPLVVSALAVAYLFFFEPERLTQKKTLVVMRIVMGITLGLFSFYLTTIDTTITSSASLGLFVVQWGMIVTMTGLFLKKK